MTRCRAVQPARHGQDGFSLIELLVAMVILALVLVLLPGVFRLAHRTWTATAGLDREAARDRGRNILQARLTEAMPIFEQGKSGSVTIVFSGTSDSVTFVAPSLNGPDNANLYRFVLHTRQADSGAGSALVVTLSPYFPSSGSGAEEHILFDGVRSVGFRYFGRKSLRGTPSWHTEWVRRDALPDLVELRVVGGGAPVSEQTVVVELRLRKEP